MKKITWTKADAKRAEKMGWKLIDYNADPEEPGYRMRRANPDRFKSDEEAIAHVKWCYRNLGMNDLRWKTADKALFFCAKG